MTRPLSYDSLKCVIQHLDPDARLQVSCHCPSIKNTEKIIPLKIGYLCLEPYAITINDKQYNMGIIRHYPEGYYSPYSVEIVNWRKSINFGVDRYGFRVHDMEVTPGDLVIGADTDDLLPKIPPFEWGHAGSDVPYTNYLQLTAVYGENRTEEIMEYNKKLGEALKYLATKFLARDLNIGTLEIDPNDENFKSCFRLPESLKFNVQNLKIRQYSANVLDVFRPFISSAPLKSIQFGWHHEERFNDPLVVNARKLILDQEGSLFDSAKLTHPRVHFHFSITFSILATMVKKWRQEGRDEGHHYSYVFRHGGPSHIDWIGRLEESRTLRIRGLGCRKYPECNVLPLTNESEVLTYVEEIQLDNIPTWILHLKTYRKGYATSLN